MTGRPSRFSVEEEARIVAEVRAGEPVKAVALARGAPYRTVLDVLHRHGVYLRACDDPARMRQRAGWVRNQRACRARRVSP